MLVKGGKLDTKFNITVPESIDAAGGAISLSAAQMTCQWLILIDKVLLQDFVFQTVEAKIWSPYKIDERLLA
jgi:hypothetical protein